MVAISFSEAATTPRRFVNTRRKARLAGCGAALLAVGLGSSAFVKAPCAARSQAALPQTAHEVDVAPALLAATAMANMLPEEALAKEGVYGPLEGKFSSLVHPGMMASFFLVTLYSGFLGWQWRRTRLITGDINDLKKQLPKEEPEDGLSAAQQKIKAEMEALVKEKADLVAEKFKDKHYMASSAILGGGIFFTVYGVFNTWFRTEKLFPGPHLFAGAAICVIWAIAGALVPYMEKGNETARTAHIGLNVVNVLLFAWQLPTGFEILLKVWGNDKLPWF